MKKVQIMVCVLAGAMALLAGLGLAVAGFVAPETMGPHCFLHRQDLAVGLAVCAAIGASFVPWRVWLKSAPWVLAGYMVVFFVSATCPLVDGWHRFFTIGNGNIIRLDTWILGWPVGALALAFIRSKVSLPSRYLLAAVVLAGMFCFTGGVLRNANRVERLHAFFTGKAESLPVPPEAVERNERAKAVKAAYLSSKLIGESAPEVVRAVPLAHTAGVSAGIAVRFGRLVHWTALALFGVIGVILLMLGRSLVESPKRVFIFVFGVWLVGLEVQNWAECMHWIPTFGVAVPLLSCTMTQCIVAGLGLGIIWSMVRIQRA